MAGNPDVKMGMELRTTIALGARNFLPDSLIPPVTRGPSLCPSLLATEFLLLFFLHLLECLIFLVHLLGLFIGLLPGLLATFAAGHGTCLPVPRPCHQNGYCWVLRVLRIFRIIVFYQICLLQIFSSILWLIFSFSWHCLSGVYPAWSSLSFLYLCFGVWN